MIAVVSAMVAAADSGNKNKFWISAESAVLVIAKQSDRNVLTQALLSLLQISPFWWFLVISVAKLVMFTRSVVSDKQH